MWRKDKCKRTIFLRPFGFMRGTEEVENSEPKRRPKAGQRSVPAWSSLEVEDFQLPQGHGEARRDIANIPK